ncbi:unnamed protein product, partial [Didymodactylos carnosus]
TNKNMALSPPNDSTNRLISLNLINNNDIGRTLTLLKTRKVLVIYTGGTIGMKAQNNVLAPVENCLQEELRRMNIAHDKQYADSIRETDPRELFLYLPSPNETECIAYYILEYKPLLDSANMTFDNYIQIALNIKDVYELFDGFVILHGTDTMSYTAAALSFMFEHLSKPIVLTGSQIPIFEARCDGRDNLIGSLIVAGKLAHRIPEVTVYFNNRLYRGNRVTKIDSEGLNAYESYNFPPLAEIGINVQVKRDLIFDKGYGQFAVCTNLNINVGVLRLYPGITAKTVRQFLESPIEGIVLQTYGSGNVPSNRMDLLDELRKATERGVIIVNCTQCIKGSVQYMYEAATYLNQINVISGHDMTVEAALMKLSFVLARYSDNNRRKQKMIQNLRGEMSVNNPHQYIRQLSNYND